MNNIHKADFHDGEGREEPLLSYTRNLEERVIPYIIVGAVSLSFLFAGAFVCRTVSSLQDELAAERQARIELEATMAKQQQEIDVLKEQLTLTPEQVSRAKQEARQEEAVQDIYQSIGRATRALLTP
ncbi:hypothetical protein ACTNCI_07445 [Mitsuokella jalaludinii]|uniref:hypothetical protein n=1 Tax=Mitsuokella jalaludinii TaxID=187979 RepID=UPI003F894785